MRPAPLHPSKLREAEDRLVEARRRIGLRDLALESVLLSVVDLELTTATPTMDVSLRPDGVARLRANPVFVLDYDVDGLVFALCHEAMHLVFGHLNAFPEDALGYLACEVVVNDWVLRHTGEPLPTSSDGERSAIDPYEIHREYQRALGHDDAVEYREFVRTDLDCARELRRLRRAPKSSAPGCGQQSRPADPHEAAALADLLDVAVQRARDGDRTLRRQLLDLADRNPDAPVWTKVGVSDLRSSGELLGKTAFWRHHLRAVVARTLRRHRRIGYDRKAGWFDAPLLRSLGIAVPDGVGMPLVRVPARDRHRHVAIYLDTSGSISDATVQVVAETIGPIPDTTVAWHTFDHAVHPFAPGEPLVGGGGTSFDAVSDHVDEQPTPPDAVIVLTDGYAPPITPTRPDRWIWLVLDDGDPWPAAAGMHCVTVHLPTGKAAA